MNDLNRLVSQGQWLVSHALMHRVALADAVRATLSQADADALARQPAALEAFLAAFAQAAQAIGTPAAEIAALAARNARLQPLVRDARTLLNFAAANARKVDEETRNTLVEVEAAVESGMATPAQEQAFLKAYEELTTALAPITVETLDASTTKLPGLVDFWKRRGPVQDPAPRPVWTLGRFINATIFILVLAGTGVTLAYYAVGASALTKYRELQESAARLKLKEADAERDLLLREAALEQLRQKATTSPAGADTGPLEQAVSARAKSKAEFVAVQDQRVAVKAELEAIPQRLGRWAQQPCSSQNFLFKAALCAEVDAPRPTDIASSSLAGVEAARTVVARMSEVYLPLLLGFLGAHAYILRRMSRQIAEKTFAKGSSFNHIVRTGLGALAGLASTWLLTPDSVGGASLQGLPTYALAFVAGYGIELVFAFMDRIITAFTQPTK
ncbi:hypothetical protein D621_09015 [beta proteobacterium AAP51]|nr:hypothetical protein D621_09015 [beta proteobacterium AAP51]